MGEAQPLLALDVSPDSIWGDEDETIVYGQVLGHGRALIFRFYLNPTNPPQSLPSRVVRCYHDIEVSDKTLTFQDRGAMRSAIWSCIATVWPSCTAQQRVFEPGTVVDVTSTETGETTWNVYREPLFDQYLDLLRNVSPTDLMRDDCPSIVHISDVVLLEAMGGKGCSKRVQVQVGSADPEIFVFKGIDFQTYLQMHDDDDIFARHAVETWRRSSKLIADASPHPNIQSPPKILVSIRGSDGGSVFMGHLSTFFRKGSLADVLGAANSSGTQISLHKKAKWCHQMSMAIAHTHAGMHTYHMDIKPGNFIVDDEENLSLIDWEQSGAPASTLAPEADGTWDVGERAAKLVYTKYTGPERRNMPEGGGRETFNVWNVFPEWQTSCPRATELAEVFALGRTIWMLLSQNDDDFGEVEHPNDVQVTWSDGTNIPARWIEMTEQCMDKDPNLRPLLARLVEFWKVEESRLESGHGHSVSRYN